jgi:Leucine-rich repeat (LRR) protein
MLDKLNCSTNMLESLDLSHNENLKYLSLMSNPFYNRLDYKIEKREEVKKYIEDCKVIYYRDFTLK